MAAQRKERLDAMDSTELCRDATGKRHVIKELRARRHRAVLKGMDWLSRYLTSDKCSALYDIGDDAPSVFFEIWYTSADSRIRCKARGIAETLIEKYESALVGGRQPATGTEQFFECMFLLRCKHEMGLDTTALLSLSDSLFKAHGLRDTNQLFGVPQSGLRNVSVADWLLLLMRVMCMEYNNLLHRKRWPLRWGLLECFCALRCVPLQPPPLDAGAIRGGGTVRSKGQPKGTKARRRRNSGAGAGTGVGGGGGAGAGGGKGGKQQQHKGSGTKPIDALSSSSGGGDGASSSASSAVTPQEHQHQCGEFHHAFYLATHIVYAIGAYSVVKTRERDVPWLYQYCRQSLRFWLKRARKKEKLGGHATKEGKAVYVDVDGVAECADVLRGTGLTEASDPLLCSASLWLLEMQSKKSGKWPVWMMGEEDDGGEEEEEIEEEGTNDDGEEGEVVNAGGSDSGGNVDSGNIDSGNVDSGIVDSGIVDSGGGGGGKQKHKPCQQERKKKQQPRPAAEHSHYSTLHPTWVSTQCLRDRDFEIGFTRPGNALWEKFMAKVLEQSNFANLEYSISYARGEATACHRDCREAPIK